MATTNINFRVDDELKKQAEELFDYLGLTMSGALTMFLKTSVNNNGIPFELKMKKDSDAIEAMKRISQRAKENGTANMTLDEINHEIAEARKNMS